MKKIIILAIVGVFFLSFLAVAAQPASAEIRETCIDPPEGPEECTIDLDPVDYCTWYLPTTVSETSNPRALWDPNTETCYFYHDNISCAPNWNMLADFYKIYTTDGIFEDDNGPYIWFNGVSGCAKFTDPENNGFRTPAVVKVYDGSVGDTKIRDGKFAYEYATCSGKCRISTTKLTHTAMRALDLMPYKIYKKAYVSIFNEAGDLVLGRYRLCFTLGYKERRAPAFYRFNGEDWDYTGGFWNKDFTKFCMYSDTYGNYLLVDQNFRQ